MFIPQLKVALVGDFDREVDAGRRRFIAATQRAVFEVADEEQAKWRQDFQQSGLASAAKLQKGIRVRRYINRGVNPAAVVSSNLPVIQAAFETGPVIRSKNGFWLTVPNPKVWPGGRVQRPRARGSKGVSSVEIAERRFGKLQFVYRPGGVSLLVANARQSKTGDGRFRKASAKAAERAKGGNYNGLATIVVFFLVKQTRLKKRLHGKELRARAQRTAPDRITGKFVKYFDTDAPVGPIRLGRG